MHSPLYDRRVKVSVPEKFGKGRKTIIVKEDTFWSSKRDGRDIVALEVLEPKITTVEKAIPGDVSK